jgi:hypothetical protein
MTKKALVPRGFARHSWPSSEGFSVERRVGDGDERHRVRPTIHGEVLAFHLTGHCPIALDAGGGVEDRITAHAAVDRIDGGAEAVTTAPRFYRGNGIWPVYTQTISHYRRHPSSTGKSPMHGFGVHHSQFSRLDRIDPRRRESSTVSSEPRSPGFNCLRGLGGSVPNKIVQNNDGRTRDPSKGNVILNEQGATGGLGQSPHEWRPASASCQALLAGARQRRGSGLKWAPGRFRGRRERFLNPSPGPNRFFSAVRPAPQAASARWS